MELSIINLMLAVGAGLASVLSPCVLPVVPIILTGTTEDDRHRPIFVIAGLVVAFLIMGIITSLFGNLLVGKMLYMEKLAGFIIIVFGILFFMDINIFERLRVNVPMINAGNGRWSGFILGTTLGIVWIPCIGPFLSSTLVAVATQGQLSVGLTLLAFYSIGFAIPMLIVGYSSLAFRQKINLVREHPVAIRLISGSILILFGIYIMTAGILGFGL